jgi:hypothetical protein
VEISGASKHRANKKTPDVSSFVLRRQSSINIRGIFAKSRAGGVKSKLRVINFVPNSRKHKTRQKLPAIQLSWELVENIGGRDEVGSTDRGRASW